jgi:hexokinase
MHEVPQNLLGPIQSFEKQFTVDKKKLKEIVNHFVKELEKGMLIP